MYRSLISAFVAGLASMALFLSVTAQAAEQLVAYNVVDEVSIPEPLTSEPGNAERGREIAINRKKGNCLACHNMPIPEQSFHGETGPDLNGVADRYDIGELRLRVVDPKVVNPDTLMPAFYRTDGFHRVGKNFKDKTILSAQEVEDLLAYLATLREQ